MRSITCSIGISCAFLVTCAASLPAQGPPPIAPLLQQMLNGDMSGREAAFDKIEAIPHADTRREVQRVFVQVLQREDEMIDSAFAANPEGGSDAAYGEGYGEYASELGDRVFRYAQLTNSEDRPTLVALADADSDGDGSVIGKWLATRSAFRFADALAMASDPRQGRRMGGRAELAAMINAARAGVRSMTATEAKDAKAAVLAGLRDTSTAARSRAQLTLSRLHDPDDAAALAAAAATEPNSQIRRDELATSAWLAKQPPVHHVHP